MYQDIGELRVYKEASALADVIWEEVDRWGGFARWTVGKQLVRAVDSIGANIAEGYGRIHVRDDVRFLYYARGSLRETRFWLERCQARKLMARDTCDSCLARLEDLAPQLNSYIKSKHRQAPERREE